MPSTTELTEAARKVGELLADHDAVKNLTAASKAFQEDTATQRALLDFNRGLQELSKKEQSGQPIEVADKHRLRDLQDAVVTSPLLARMQTAQMDYFDTLRKIDATIQEAAGIDESTATGMGGGSAPSGAAGAPAGMGPVLG